MERNERKEILRAINGRLSEANNDNDNDNDMNPPVPKRLRMSEPISRQTNESSENSPSLQFDSEASDNQTSPLLRQVKATTSESPGRGPRSNTPPESLESIEALRTKWAEKLDQIQQKEPTRGSGSFRLTDLAEMCRVLEASHPNLSVEYDQERKELLKMVDFKVRYHNSGAFGWADLSCLRLIFLAPLIPERTIIEDLENEACQVDLEARARRPFPLTAVRRLKRVFERCVPNYHQDPTYHQIQAALQEKETKRNPLGLSVLKRCLELLFPEAQSMPSSAAKSTPTLTKRQAPVNSADHSRKTPKLVDSAAPSPSPSNAPTRGSSLSSRKHHTATSTPRRSQPSKVSLLDNDASKQLLGIYLNVHHLVLPIFGENTIKAAFQEVRSVGDVADAYHAAIVSICLSLGAMADTWSKTPGAPAATDLYNHGQLYLPSVQEKHSTLRLIQCHILQAQYQFQVGDLNEASVSISSAVSRAHAEGMHTKAGAYLQNTEVNLELRRSIWHTIQILQRSLALYRGIEPPNFCSDCDAPFPEPTALQRSDGTNGSQSNELRSLGFKAFNAWARLFQGIDHLMEIERDFRIQDGGCQMHKIACDFDAYNQAHKRLTHWKQSLPRILTNTDSFNQSATRLCKIIQLRYLYLQLRLHRPLFILAIGLSFKCTECSIEQPHLRDTSLESPLEFAIIRSGFARCLKAAGELRNLLDTLSTNPLLSAFLTELSEFAYACGLILTAACMVTHLIGTSGLGLSQQRCEIWADGVRVTLLTKHEEASRRHKLLNTRISRSKEVLLSLSKTVSRNSDPRAVVKNVNIPSNAWHRLYGRLRLEYQDIGLSSPFVDAPSPYAWMESQLMDLDD